MATYLVLSAKSGPDKDPDAIFVRDGFSLTAAVFPLLWLLWHRMWVWALFLVLVLIGTSFGAGSSIGDLLAACFMFASGLYFGFEGRQLYVASLIKRGFSVRSVLDAPDLETAETAYFHGAAMVFSRSNTDTKTEPTASKNMQGVGIFDSYGGI